jgi:hypothetical protein
MGPRGHLTKRRSLPQSKQIKLQIAKSGKTPSFRMGRRGGDGAQGLSHADDTAIEKDDDNIREHGEGPHCIS